MRRWTDCKLFYFLFRFGRHYSSILLVLMSVEKCFAVYFPLKSLTVCTVRTAKWAAGIVAVILAGYDSLYFFAVDSILYSFVPFALMIVVNFAIAFKFMRAKCKRYFTESTNQALSKSATRGTAMVVTVSVTFLLLTAPTGVYNVVYK